METEMKELVDKIVAVKAQISKRIVGQKDIIHQLLLAILSDGNVLLEGVPGLGKTQLVKTLSEVMDLSFSRIQFTPDLMPADVTGTNLIVKENDRNVFRFQEGPVFANIVLADEINRATPKTQSALLEAMQEKTVTVGNKTYSLPSPFMVLATQNPIEQEGTYPLPEAQLDRFLFRLDMEFPTVSELKEIMDLTVSGKQTEISPVISGDEIIKIRKMIVSMPIAEPVQDYALRLVVGTHPELSAATENTKKNLTAGASPRAAQAIFLTAKARAFLDGRYNVSFEDIKFVAPPALRHRLVLSFDALSEGITEDNVIADLLNEVKE